MIQAVHPPGAYHLGCYSSGATLAVEMARQLGGAVHDILLFDRWAIYPNTIKQKTILDHSLKRQQQQWRKQFSEQNLFLERLLKLQGQRAQLFEQYHVSPISHPLILFKAQTILSFFATMPSPFNHWDQYALSPITVHLVPGSHETILEKNNLPRIIALCSI